MNARVLLCAGVFLLAGCTGGREIPPAIALWATGESRKVGPDDPAEDANYHWDAGTGTVSLTGAANEQVAFQLVLRSPRPVSGAALEASGLEGDAPGTSIPSGAVSFFAERYITVSVPTDRAGSTGAGEYPDPLIPFRDPYSPGKEDLALPLELVPDRNLPIWVDCAIPPGTPAGTYRGKIVLAAQGKELRRLNLVLKVRGFSLPDRPSLPVFFDLYGARWSRGEGLPWRLGEETWEVLKQYEIMAHEHGFSNGHWGLMPAGASSSTEGVDWSLYDRYLGTVLDGSLFADGTPPACWELPYPERWNPGEEVLEAYTRDLVRHWDEQGWNLEDAFAYVWDEMGPTHPTVEAWGRTLRRASEGRVNYFYTCPPHPALYGIVDWWAPRASAYMPEETRKRQGEGERCFFYHAGEPSVGLMCIDATGLAFRTWAWMAWIYGCDGFFDWAANFWSENPYLDPLSFDTDNGNMYLFYPGRQLDTVGLRAIKGPVPSFRLKALRRGIQDYEYFRIARRAGLDVEPTVRSVVRKGLGVAGAYGIDPRAWSRDPEDWYRARDRIGEMIEDVLGRRGEKALAEADPVSR
ncbi:MAG TPA: DUF4091 domain-containing protein [bacterium]|nr:DUF4091 domain-containing protein [bacterium]HPQ66371.1 DUF4091 domain-containing protein [bacterium]